jgi:quinol monooxygenase YgiN
MNPGAGHGRISRGLNFRQAPPDDMHDQERLMVIVSGTIYVRHGTRETFLAASMEAVAAARGSPGCLDFVVAADPIEPDRVNVYEQWESAAQLEAFRGDGPGGELSSDIVKADVSRHQVSSSGPA